MKLTIFLLTLSILFPLNNIAAQNAITIEYDDLDRIKRIDYGGGIVWNSVFDANGNMVSEIVNSNSYVRVKLTVSGQYNILTQKLNQIDTSRAYLMNVTSPFLTVDSSIALIDSISFETNFEFRNAPTGTYYLKIKHRNSIETWSKSGGFVFTRYAMMNYDFTSSQTQAYGNNLTQIENVWGIYSGDVNQDGMIDGTDAAQIDNGIMSFLSGYVSADLTGDNFVDAADAAIADNNVRRFVSVIRP